MMRINISSVVIICSVLIVTRVPAQTDTFRNRIDHDKSQFEKIMESETGSIAPADSNRMHQYYLLAEELPGWFFNPGKHATTPDFFIGISEPGMDSAKATELAVLRAKSLAVLSGKAYIDNVSDNFQVVREAKNVYDENSHYLDFSRLYTESTVDSSAFEVNKTFYSKYGESIALVSYKRQNEGRDTLTVSGEIMQLSREDTYGVENTVFCKLDMDYSGYGSIRRSVRRNQFVFKSRGDHFNIMSVFNQDSIEFPTHPYRYTHPEKPEIDSTLEIRGYPVNLGLWNAYINLLFSQVNFFNRKLESKVKTSYDDFTLKNQKIIRTVSKNALRFRIDSMLMNDNKLYMKLDLSTH